MGLADFETFLRATRTGLWWCSTTPPTAPSCTSTPSKGLHDQAMLIDEVDFAAVGRALGAEGIKATHAWRTSPA